MRRRGRRQLNSRASRIRFNSMPSRATRKGIIHCSSHTATPKGGVCRKRPLLHSCGLVEQFQKRIESGFTTRARACHGRRRRRQAQGRGVEPIIRRGRLSTRPTR